MRICLCNKANLGEFSFFFITKKRLFSPNDFIVLKYWFTSQRFSARMLTMNLSKFFGLFIALTILITQFPVRGSDIELKFQKILTVQKAMLEGAEHFKKGNYQAAVFILESHIASIDGNKEYLSLLKNAYHGHIKNLEDKGLPEETGKYQQRLQILESTALAPTKVAPVATTMHLSVNNALVVNTPVINTPTVITKAPETSTAIPTIVVPSAFAGLSAIKKNILGNPSKIISAAPKVRAKVEDSIEDNPFAYTNSQRYYEAMQRLNQAEKEFAGKNFKLASKLFDETYRLEPKAMPQSVERWAYCRLYSVVEAMNQKQNVKLDPSWENEIRTCLSLAPQLQSFGNQLLQNIDSRKLELGNIQQQSNIEVKHTGPYQGNWYLAETKNFRVWHHLSQADATNVAKSSEVFRVEAAMKWFGSIGADWNPICEIYLHPSAQEYSKSTGAPSVSPGHTTLRTEGSRVLARRIDLHTDDANMMTGVLPHETTHIVLAGRLGEQPVPRWADEGMAVLAEPKNRIQKHLDNLPKHARENTLFPISKLMQMADYPEPKLVGPFYAQSVSLVDYLTRLRGPQAFSDFMKDGLKNGYEGALLKHYGFENYNDLNQRWWTTTFNPTNTASNN